MNRLLPSRLITLLAVAATLVVLMPSVAAAQQDEDGEDYDTMLELSNAGAESVADGQFEIGAIQFRQAYEHYADPVLLNNEMIAWYRAEDCHNALEPAERLREIFDEQGDELESDDRRNVRTVMVECRLNLAEEALGEDHPILADYQLERLGDAQLEDDERDRYQQLRDALPDHIATDASSDQPPPSAQPASGSAHLGWAQVTAGIAVAGLGLSMHTVALNRQSQLRELSEQDSELFEQRQDEWAGFQNTARWAVPALYVVGAAAIGSGTFFLLRDDTDEEAVSLGPSLAPRGAGLSLSGRF